MDECIRADPHSFQTGCGNDPLDSGCCYYEASAWSCEYCEEFTVVDGT